MIMTFNYDQQLTFNRPTKGLANFVVKEHVPLYKVTLEKWQTVGRRCVFALRVMIRH